MSKDPIAVATPSWLDRTAIRVLGARSHHFDASGLLRLEHDGGEIHVEFPLAARNLTFRYRGEDLRARLRGDQVEQMEHFDARLTFFDSLE